MTENKTTQGTPLSKEPKREKVRIVPIEYIDDFPDHPFLVKDDEEMEKLKESILNNGVLTPILVRKKEGDRYEIISGHRRKHACQMLGVTAIPMIIRDVSRDEAVIAMVDSNLQRDKILPSEKARAYKMKMDAMKRQGERTDLTCAPVGHKLQGEKTRDVIANESDDSREQIRRYIRLTELIPELLEDVDLGKIAFRPAVELSYLTEEEQKDVSYTIDTEDRTPSLAQAIRMKEMSREGDLDFETITEIMTQDKPNQKPKFKMPMEPLERYFSRSVTPQEMEQTILKALDEYFKRLRARTDRDSR